MWLDIAENVWKFRTILDKDKPLDIIISVFNMCCLIFCRKQMTLNLYCAKSGIICKRLDLSWCLRSLGALLKNYVINVWIRTTVCFHVWILFLVTVTLSVNSGIGMRFLPICLSSTSCNTNIKVYLALNKL